MGISREDLEAGRIDLSDLRADAEPVRLSHPGAVLRGEFLEPLEITAYRLAKDIGVPLNRVTAILDGTRAISADTALRLGRFFGMSAAFWLGLQQAYDLDRARAELGDRLDSEVRPLRAA